VGSLNGLNLGKVNASFGEWTQNFIPDFAVGLNGLRVNLVSGQPTQWQATILTQSGNIYRYTRSPDNDTYKQMNPSGTLIMSGSLSEGYANMAYVSSGGGVAYSYGDNSFGCLGNGTSGGVNYYVGANNSGSPSIVSRTSLTTGENWAPATSCANSAMFIATTNANSGGIGRWLYAGQGATSVPIAAFPFAYPAFKVFGGSYNSMFWNSGAVYIAGDNNFGQCGPLASGKTSQSTFVLNTPSLNANEQIADVCSMNFNTLVLTSSGRLLVTGYNSSGELGIPSLYQSGSYILANTFESPAKFLTTDVGFSDGSSTMVLAASGLYGAGTDTTNTSSGTVGTYSKWGWLQSGSGIIRPTTLATWTKVLDLNINQITRGWTSYAVTWLQTDKTVDTKNYIVSTPSPTPSNTPSPTPSNTPSPTPSPSPSLSPSPTPSPTQSPTPTPTLPGWMAIFVGKELLFDTAITPIPTESPTPSPSLSPSPTPSPTPSLSPSGTPSPTPSYSPSPTPSYSPSPTPSETPSPTPSPSPSKSPSPTPSPSPSNSPSPTPSPTGPTPTPSQTPTPSPTLAVDGLLAQWKAVELVFDANLTPIPTATPTATATAIPTATATVTPTPSPTPSPTLSGTPSSTPSPSASNTPSPTPSPSPSNSPSPTPSPSPSPSPSPTPSPTPTIPGFLAQFNKDLMLDT
jgi:hypothetical protein